MSSVIQNQPDGAAQNGEELLDQIQAPLAPITDYFGDTLFKIGDTDVTIMTLVTVLTIIVLTFVISIFVRRILVRAFRRRGMEEGVSYAIGRLIHYVILFVGLIIALDNLGISLTGLAAIGAILGVGIGFGLQDIAQNFISGLILLIERPVKKGDFIVVGTVRGTVQKVGARATVVRTLDNMDILVPNSEFINEQVVNETYGDRKLRGRVEVGVAYGSDTGKVREVLEKVASEHVEVLDDPEPNARFTAFGESSLDFTLFFMIGNPRRLIPVESDIRFGVDRAFREAGIEIPFPQRDLHVRSGGETIGGK